MTPTPSPASSGSEAPAPPRPAALVRRPLLAVFGYVRRHPGRTLAAVALVALIALGLGVGGTQIWAAYHFRAARKDLDRYHTAEAGQHLRACLRVWPNDADVLLLAARAARRSELFDEATEFLERYLEVRGRDDALTLERALLTAERGDLDDVLEFCTAKVLANDPATPLILEALARGCLRAYRLPDADWAVRTWQQRDPDDPMGLLLLGRVQRELNADAAAAASFRRALELDPEMDDARDHLTALLVDSHQAAEALPHLEYLVGRRPDDPNLLVRQARCHDLLGDQDRAAELLDRVLARCPRYPAALVERGKLALAAGQDAEAEALLRRALERAPWEQSVLPLLHSCLAHSGQDDKARALEPRMKEAKESMERLDHLMTEDLQKDPHNAEAQYEVGTILMKIGSYGKGLQRLESAVRLNPRHAKAHEALADFYTRIGETAKAARHQKLARAAAEGLRRGRGT